MNGRAHITTTTTILSIIILVITEKGGKSFAFLTPRDAEEIFRPTRCCRAPSKNIAATITTDNSRFNPWDSHHFKYLTPHCYLKKSEEDGNDENEAYFEAMKEAAKDPARFQAFVTEHTKRRKAKKEEEERSRFDGDGEGDGQKGYVPIEQWDQERSQSEDGISWEEKVRFDGQRFGNRYEQNEILRKNLK